MFDDWARQWGVPAEALEDLRARLGAADRPGTGDQAQAEARVQDDVRLAASRRGFRLWRNNVGAFKADNGGFVRYGLCNDSARLNAKLKSSDLIGIRPVKITPAHVGKTIGQFVAFEVKRGGWRYRGKGREEAQLRFLGLVVSLGGLARFVTKVQDVESCD